MKVAGVLFITSVTAAGLLLIRRILRIRKAVSSMNHLAHMVSLDTLPRGFFRVCITGTSSGIGLACAEFLSQYTSVSIVKIGRSGTCDIHTDLSEVNAARSCSESVERIWYRNAESPSAGLDVVINNAGLFRSTPSSRLWFVNALSPAYLTEDLTQRYIRSGLKSRALRFVQVSSRLESQSTLTPGNIWDVISGSIDGSRLASARSHYADSKREMIHHTSFMHHKYAISNPSVSYVAVTPGMVNTSLGKSTVWGFVWFLTYPLRFLFLRSPIEGALPILWAAFGCPTESGVFTADQAIIERISETRDPALGAVFSQIVHESFNTF